MLEAEAGNAGGKQQGGVEIRATRELRLLKTSDGERLTLRAAFAKMVAGGGQDFGCGFGQGKPSSILPISSGASAPASAPNRLVTMAF